MAKRRWSLFSAFLTAVLVVGCAAGQKAPAGPSAGDALSSAPDVEERDADALENDLLDQESVIVRELLPPAAVGAESESLVPSGETPPSVAPGPPPREVPDRV